MGGYWDRLCSRCGLCCFEKHHRFRKSSRGRTVPAVSSLYYIDLDEPCAFLDTESRLCTEYNQRFKVCRDCGRLTLFHALFAGYLPRDCAYVKKFRIWRRHK